MVVAVLPGAASAESVSFALHSADGTSSTLLAPAALTPAAALPTCLAPPGDMATAGRFEAGARDLMSLLACGEESTWAKRAGIVGGAESATFGATPYLAGVTDGFSSSWRGLGLVHSAALARSAVFVGGTLPGAAGNLEGATGPSGSSEGAVEVALAPVGEIPVSLRLPDQIVTGSAGEVRRIFVPDVEGGPRLVELAGDGDALATPEPASLILIGTGLAGMAVLRRRRERD